MQTNNIINLGEKKRYLPKLLCMQDPRLSVDHPVPWQLADVVPTDVYPILQLSVA